MARYILIDSMRLDALKADYIHYPLYYHTLEEAREAAVKMKLQKFWILKNVDYLQHIYTGTKAVIL